jgi:hypothetical protein
VGNAAFLGVANSEEAILAHTDTGGVPVAKMSPGTIRM